MNSVYYTQFLETKFVPQYNSLILQERKSTVFMTDNASSHASKYTADFLKVTKIFGDRLMTWPEQSPDLNSCENLWSAVKREIYQGGKQYSNCNDLWVSIKASCESQAEILIRQHIKSMDN